MASTITGMVPWAADKQGDVGIKPIDARFMVTSLLTQTASSGPISGLLPFGSWASQTPASGRVHAQTTPDMTVAVQPCPFVYAHSDGTVYIGGTADVGSLDVSDADSTDDRIDLVVARIHDGSESLDSGLSSAIEIVTGTAAQTPSVPDAPDGSFGLAKITVTAGAQSITDDDISWLNPPYIVPNGAIPPIYTDSNATHGAYPGAYRDNQKVLERFDGASWDTVIDMRGWQPWTPSLVSDDGGNLQIGDGGFISGNYLVVGKVAFIRLRIQFGSAHVFGGGGNIYWTLPDGIRPSTETDMFAHLATPAGFFSGYGLPGSDGHVYTYISQSASNAGLALMRNALADQKPSNGIPNVPNGYPIDNGSNYICSGFIAL